MIFANLTPLSFSLTAFGCSIVAGALGSLLGLGGGIIVIPALTLLLGVDIRYAIGASLISVIATSSGAAAAYVRERMTNLRVAMFLEIATTCGALSGAYLSGHIATRWLYVIFGFVLIASAISMLRKRREHAGLSGPHDALSDRLRLHGEYFDQALGQIVAYRVIRAKLGFALMYVAGILSGLMGIGSGVLKVPAMDLAMHLPIKVSSATSNFMMGVTAAASAGVYFMRGDINPFVAAPVAAGVLIGSVGGSLLMGRLPGLWIRRVFVVVLLWVSIEMLMKGLRQ